MLAIRQTIGGLGNIMFKNAYIYSQMRKGMIPDIYVQDEKYFKEYADEIKQLYGDNIGYVDKVSLHIRRGDYLEKKGFYVDLTKTDYYKRAVDMFPNETFLVFYKDRQDKTIDHNDENFAWQFMDDLGVKFEIYEGTSEVNDLNTMASCKHHIMANSSFSWWASYLGKGMTICPKDWFSDGVMRIGLLEEWIKI